MFAVVTFLGIGVDYGIHLVHRYQEHGDAVRATAELAPVILVAGADHAARLRHADQLVLPAAAFDRASSPPSAWSRWPRRQCWCSRPCC